jgi:hypothetical protein
MSVFSFFPRGIPCPAGEPAPQPAGSILAAPAARHPPEVNLFWRYAFDDAYSLTRQIWCRPMSPPVLVVMLMVTAFVVALVKAGVFA